MLSPLQALPATTWALIALSAFVVGTLHTVSGLAGGVMLSIILSPLIGVEKVVPVLSVALLIGATSRLWFFRLLVDWKVYRAIMITAIPGMITGAVIYSLLSPRMIMGLIGVFLIVSIIARHTLEHHRFEISMRGFSLLGVLFGVVSGSTVGGGMLLVPFFFGAGLTGERFVAMIGAIGFTLNSVKVITFSALSLLGAEVIAMGFVIGIFLIPGNYLGFWIIKRTPVRIHSGVVETIVLVGAIHFVWSAIYLT